MTTKTIGKHTVELYDSIEELPIKRFHAFNKMLLIDAGIGSDMADFDTHIQKAIIYAQSKQPELAVTELENLRQNVYMIHANLSPRHLALAALVKTMDEKPCEDLSQEGLQRIVDMFADATNKEITTLTEAVKKKIDDELRMYFPAIFDDVLIKEYFDNLRQRTLLLLESIVQGEDAERTREIDRITSDLMTFNKPHTFTGTDNAEIAYDKNFERMCATLCQYLHVEPKRYTVMEFYNAYEYVRDLLKAQNKARKGAK